MSNKNQGKVILYENGKFIVESVNDNSYSETGEAVKNKRILV